MKNVRLFAVAAAIGMFASTVSAATTGYKTTWGNLPEGEIVRAEINGKVVAPALTAEVTQTTQSGSGTATKVCVGVDGATRNDMNLDGVADQAFYRMDKEDRGFLYFTDAKFSPTPNTFTYYMSMTREGAGRILAPGAAAVSGYIDATSHTVYDGKDATKLQAMIDMLVANKLATVSEDEDGYISYTLNAAKAADAIDYEIGTYYLVDDTITAPKKVNVILNGTFPVATEKVSPADGSAEITIDANPIYSTDAAGVKTVAAPSIKTAVYTVNEAKTIVTGGNARVATANQYAADALLDYVTGFMSDDTVSDALIKGSTNTYFNGTKLLKAVGAHFEGSTVAVGGLINVEDDAGKKFDATAASLAAASTFSFYVTDRRGNLGADATADKKTITIAATPSASAVGIDFFADLTKSEKDKIATGNAIIVVDKEITATNRADSIANYNYAIYEIKAETKNVASYKYVWNADDQNFVKVAADVLGGAASDVTTVAGVNAIIDQFGGLYKIDTPANDTDKFVVDIAMGVYGDTFDLATKKGVGDNVQVSLSKARATFTFTQLPDNNVGLKPTADKPYVVKAVDFGGRNYERWLPVFDTRAEAVQFMNAMAGVQLAGSDYITDMEKFAVAAKALNKEAKSVTIADMPATVKLANGTEKGGFTWGSFKVALDHNRTLVDGSKVAYVPTNILDHTTAPVCVYSGDATKVEGVVVTNNADTIDATTAGVKELTYTAKVGETVVGTKTLKVVIAPKYERVYANGRVKTLKAFHLNGNLYAVYNYDYAAKKVTVTFYDFDGVTVSSTSELPL